MKLINLLQSVGQGQQKHQCSSLEHFDQQHGLIIASKATPPQTSFLMSFFCARLTKKLHLDLAEEKASNSTGLQVSMRWSNLHLDKEC